MPTHRISRTSGFTLIDILVVVIILGILATVIISQFGSASKDAKLASLRYTVNVVQEQLEIYRFQTNSRPSVDNFWLQLSDRQVVDGKNVGPWIMMAAVNPFSGGTTVGASSASGFAWAYDLENNRFYGNAAGTWIP